jgi:hypothetical protein
LFSRIPSIFYISNYGNFWNELELKYFILFFKPLWNSNALLSNVKLSFFSLGHQTELISSSGSYENLANKISALPPTVRYLVLLNITSKDLSGLRDSMQKLFYEKNLSVLLFGDNLLCIFSRRSHNYFQEGEYFHVFKNFSNYCLILPDKDNSLRIESESLMVTIG